MDDDDKEILLKRELEELKVFVQQKKVELKQKSAEYESFRKRKESARKNTRVFVLFFCFKNLQRVFSFNILGFLNIFFSFSFFFFQSSNLSSQ